MIKMSRTQLILPIASFAVIFAMVKASSDTVYSDNVYYRHEVTTAPAPESTRNCYQCSYTPSKTTYVEKEVAIQIQDPRKGGYKLVRQKKLVPEKKVGGWDKCGGSFSNIEATGFGIDMWPCKHNCFVRKDVAGNLFRGCFRGEYGVDPYNLNDIQQVGNSLYKFCDSPLCNNFDPDKSF